MKNLPRAFHALIWSIIIHTCGAASGAAEAKPAVIR